MGKNALVLSGGGGKGAFQFAAEKYAREVKGYRWDIIAGVSIGALNGTMLAMERYQRIEELWRTVTADQIYTGGMNPWSILKLIFGAKSLYGNRPLWEMIDEEVDPDAIRADLRIGAVSLRTGQYLRFRPTDRGFKKAVLASTAIPLVWAPVDVSPSRKDMVDGGVRNVSPLGDVLDADPDEVVIINCDPRRPPGNYQGFRNALEIGRAALGITINEIFANDIREFVRINRNVQEAAAHGVTLHNEHGKPFKHFDYKLIEPKETLGDSLDFSREAIDRYIELGWERAREVLG
jgi:NTE family protein